MNPREERRETSTRASLRPLIESLRGERDPMYSILNAISERVTGNMGDEANAMRVELYLGDVFTIAQGAGKKTDEELLEEVRKTDGFLGIELSSIAVSDATTLSFLSEMKAGLSALGSQES